MKIGDLLKAKKTASLHSQAYIYNQVKQVLEESPLLIDKNSYSWGVSLDSEGLKLKLKSQENTILAMFKSQKKILLEHLSKHLDIPEENIKITFSRG